MTEKSMDTAMRQDWQRLLIASAAELQCDAPLLTRARPAMQQLLTTIQQICQDPSSVKDQQTKSTITNVVNFLKPLEKKGMKEFKAIPFTFCPSHKSFYK